MSKGRITHYIERHPHITTHIEAEVPQAVHSGWSNFVSQRSVRAMAIAPRSRLLWLATWGGIISWNRREELLYRRFSSEHGLAGNSAACICVDQMERPWVGHVEGGLSYFDGQRWQVYDHLQLETLRAVNGGANLGGIWAATRDAVYHIPSEDEPPVLVASSNRMAVAEALALLDVGDRLLLGNSWGLFSLGIDRDPIPLAQGTIKTCTALTRDREGSVWVGTPEEVYRLDGDVPVGPIIPESAETSGRVLQLAASWDRIWVLTTTGLAQIMESSWLPLNELPEQHPTLYAIAADLDETSLWVGTDRLLACVQTHRQSAPLWKEDWLPLQPVDMVNNLGRCILQQKLDGRVWVGTAGGLLAFSPDDSWKLYDESGDIRALGLSGRETSSEVQRTLWALAWPHGIRRWIGSGLVDSHDHQPANLITAFTLGQDGSPYFLAGHALWRISDNGLEEVTRSIPSEARCLVQTPDEQWWLGTARGVYRLVSGKWELAGDQPGPLQAGIRALAVAHGYLWAATETGLWQRRHEQWERYDILPDDKLCDVRALAPARDDGALWLAREDSVARYDPAIRKLSLEYTRANSGLASCRVTALAEIGGTLWIVTQGGISRLKLV